MKEIIFDEVVLTLRGTDKNGKRKVYKFNHSLAPFTSVNVSATRAVKKKGKRFIPNEFTFHQISFITS